VDDSGDGGGRDGAPFLWEVLESIDKITVGQDGHTELRVVVVSTMIWILGRIPPGNGGSSRPEKNRVEANDKIRGLLEMSERETTEFFCV